MSSQSTVSLAHSGSRTEEEEQPGASEGTTTRRRESEMITPLSLRHHSVFSPSPLSSIHHHSVITLSLVCHSIITPSSLHHCVITLSSVPHHSFITPSFCCLLDCSSACHLQSIQQISRLFSHIPPGTVGNGSDLNHHSEPPLQQQHQQQLLCRSPWKPAQHSGPEQVQDDICSRVWDQRLPRSGFNNSICCFSSS